MLSLRSVPRRHHDGEGAGEAVMAWETVSLTTGGAMQLPNQVSGGKGCFLKRNWKSIYLHGSFLFFHIDSLFDIGGCQATHGHRLEPAQSPEFVVSEFR